MTRIESLNTAFWENDEEYLKGKTRKELEKLRAHQEPFMFSM